MKSTNTSDQKEGSTSLLFTLWAREQSVRLFFYSQIAYGLATSIFDMLYSLHLTALGISDSSVGTLFLAGFLAMAMLVVPLGTLADRYSQNAGMWTSSLGFGGCMVLIPFVSSYTGQVISFVLASIFSAVMLTTTTTVMARHTPDEKERLVVLQFGFMAFLISSALGAGIGGWLVGVLPQGNTDYQWSLILAGLVGVVIGGIRLLLALMVPLPTTQKKKQQEVKAKAQLVSSRPVVLLLILSVLVGGFSVLGIRFSTIILVNHFQMPLTQMGFLVAIDKILSIISIFVLSRYVKQGREAFSAAILMIVVLPLQIAGAFATTAMAFAIPFLITRGLYYSQAPILDWVTNHIASDDRRAFMNSMERLGLFIGSGLAAQLYGFLLQHNFSLAMISAGLFAALAGGVYLMFANFATSSHHQVSLEEKEQL